MSLYRKINPNLSRKAKQNEIADSSSNETLPWSPWSTEASIERLGFLYDAPLCWINHPSTEPLGKSPQSNGYQPTIDRDSLEVISNLIQRACSNGLGLSFERECLLSFFFLHEFRCGLIYIKHSLPELGMALGRG